MALIKICNRFSFYSQPGVPVAAPSVLGEVSHTHFRVHTKPAKQLPEVSNLLFFLKLVFFFL